MCVGTAAEAVLPRPSPNTDAHTGLQHGEADPARWSSAGPYPLSLSVPASGRHWLVGLGFDSKHAPLLRASAASDMTNR
jgi:hypothetical protein